MRTPIKKRIVSILLTCSVTCGFLSCQAVAQQKTDSYVSPVPRLARLGDVLDRCERPTKPEADAILRYLGCLSYVAGMLDAIQLYDDSQLKSAGIVPLAGCLPKGYVDVDTALGALRVYAAKDESRKKELLVLALISSLNDAFPCKK